MTATPGPARPLAGRRALVTGAASGIGRAAALSLAAAGATVAAVDADPAVAGLEAELSSADAGPGPHAAVCDVRDPAEVAATVARAAAALGGLDLVVTAAGSWRRTPLSMPLPEAAAVLRDLLEVNLTGTFLVGRAAAPYLSRDGGDLVLVSTDHVWTCGVPTHVGHGDAPDCPWAGRRERRTGGGPEMDAYDASKWALNGLTGAWSRALRPAGVRVNAVCPGATDTPMLRAVLPEPPPPVLAPADVAALVVALVLEGRGGRTGENVGAWPGHPLVLLPPGTGTEPTMDGTTVRRLELLEAREEVAARFAEYLHHLDAGYVSELVEVFTPDGRVEAVNFPLGPGTTLTAVGRGEIAALYGRFPPTMRRHHATNVVIRVEPDLATAELSSYFLRSGPFEFGGGLYQAGLRRGQDGWRLHRLRVVSTWTWSLKEARVPDLDVPFGAGAERAGRPVDVRTPPAGPRPGPGSPAG